MDIFAAGLEVIGQIQEPGFLEGGDFTPAGQDLALLGIGLRSNMEAAQQLMDQDLLGARRLAVVKDDFEQHQACHTSPGKFKTELGYQKCQAHSC